MSDSGFLSNRRPVRLAPFAELGDAIEYTRGKASAWAKGKSGLLTAADRATVSRALQELASDFEAGLHVGGGR